VTLPPDGHRDGYTYEPEFDYNRLNRQARDVYLCLLVGEWWTLRELADATGWPEASVSARLRDLRKPRFGGFIVQRQRVGEGGLFHYRLAGRKGKEDAEKNVPQVQPSSGADTPF